MADTATVAVLFCDLVSSTERQTRLGDDAADGFRRRFFAALRAPVAANGGTEIKTLGDGLMATFESTTGALLCAIEMHHAMRDLDPDDPVLLRIGISVGEVGHEDDDWFGTPVVEAARLQSAASPGETFATSVVRTVVGSRGSKLRYAELGPMQLKGLPLPIDVVAVAGDGDELPEIPPAPPRPASRPVPAGEPAMHRRAGRMRTIAALVVGMLIVAGSAWALDLAVDHDDRGSSEEPRRAAASITKPSGYRPSFRKMRCSANTLTAVPDAECGQLIVPEVRAKPLGRKVSVDVVRAPATGEVTSPPVILADVNEPLASTPLREHADVYAMTLRGLSPFDRPRLDCPELREVWLETLAVAPDDVGAIGRRRAAASECAARLRSEGVQLEGYNLVEVANDLRDLVIARDLGQVAVAAGGVSTPAAVAFARANRGAVDSLLLANPTPPGESPLADPTTSLSRSFGALVELCQQQERCRTRFPDMAGQYRERVAQFDAAPRSVLATPLDPDDPGVHVLLDGRRMGSALAQALKSSDQLPLVPTAIAPDGVSPELLAAASINEDLLLYAGDDAVAGAVLSYFCSYDAHLNQTAQVAEAALAEFAGANNPSLQALCSGWDVPVVFDRINQPLSGDLPVLFAEGGLSTAGANRWSDQMAQSLPNATVVHLPTLSEDVVFRQPPCLQAIRQAFLARPRAETAVRTCETASPPIPFVGL